MTVSHLVSCRVGLWIGKVSMRHVQVVLNLLESIGCEVSSKVKGVHESDFDSAKGASFVF